MKTGSSGLGNSLPEFEANSEIFVEFANGPPLELNLVFSWIVEGEGKRKVSIPVLHIMVVIVTLVCEILDVKPQSLWMPTLLFNDRVYYITTIPGSELDSTSQPTYY